MDSDSDYDSDASTAVEAASNRFIKDYIAKRTDPASKVPGMPPNFGQEVVPHTVTFQSFIGTYSRSYLNPDEAVRDSIDNAFRMKRDVGLMECVEARKRYCANLDWEVVPENENCQYQVSLAQMLQRTLRRIPRFGQYLEVLMDAIWVGRSAIQNRYGFVKIDGTRVLMPKPTCADHPGWQHINGDKIVFRYDQVEPFLTPGAYAHQMGIKVNSTQRLDMDLLKKKWAPEPTGNGMAVFLQPYERETFCVHKHFLEDSEFEHSELAGSIHGVGIRSRIYWEWWLKQEAFAFLMQYLERSASGIEIWYYPQGDDNALARCKQHAAERQANGRNTIFFPKPLGEDSSAYNIEYVEPGAVGLDIIQNIVERYFGGRLKRYILGQELSSEATGTGLGSGVADAHMETLAQIIRYDARNLEQTVTDELVRVIQKYNWPETLEWQMRFVLKTESDKAKSQMESLKMAQEMGARIPESAVFKLVGLTNPKPDDRILTPSAGGGGFGGGMGGPQSGELDDDPGPTPEKDKRDQPDSDKTFDEKFRQERPE